MMTAIAIDTNTGITALKRFPLDLSPGDQERPNNIAVLLMLNPTLRKNTAQGRLVRAPARILPSRNNGSGLASGLINKTI